MHTQNVVVECTVHAHTLLGGKNVTEERVSLFSLRQVGVSSLFHLPKSSGKEQSSELWGGVLFMCACVCVFNYGHENIKVLKCLCI